MLYPKTLTTQITTRCALWQLGTMGTSLWQAGVMQPLSKGCVEMEMSKMHVSLCLNANQECSKAQKAFVMHHHTDDACSDERLKWNVFLCFPIYKNSNHSICGCFAPKNICAVTSPTIQIRHACSEMQKIQYSPVLHFWMGTSNVLYFSIQLEWIYCMFLCCCTTKYMRSRWKS